jgi:Smr domain
MKFEVGDKVILLHSKEAGVITEILSDEMLMVKVESVVFPVYADQVDFPYFDQFTQPKKAPEKKLIPGEYIRKEKNIPPKTQETGMWLSFLPVYETIEYEEVINLFKMHLVNETKHLYLFDYQLFYADHLELSVKSESLPFSHFYLHDMLLEQFNDNPHFSLAFSLGYPDDKMENQTSIHLKLKAKQLFKKLEEMRQRQEASFSFLLFEQYPARKIPSPGEMDLLDFAKLISPPKVTTTAPPEILLSEVDLHIEKLVPTTRGLTNLEMLSIQLNEFQKNIDLAITYHMPSLVVIHGIGKGKLRDEIHEQLRHIKEVSSFVNQYHPRYGFGATEIFFKY